MDAFFVTVSLLTKPEWKDLPVAVAHGGEHSQIASANYAARKFGVQNGYSQQLWIFSRKGFPLEVRRPSVRTLGFCHIPLKITKGYPRRLGAVIFFFNP